MAFLRGIVMSVRIAGSAIVPVIHALPHGGWRLASTARSVNVRRAWMLPLRCVRVVSWRICGVRTVETPTAPAAAGMKRKRMIGMDIRLMRKGQNHVTVARVRNMMGTMDMIPNVKEDGSVCVSPKNQNNKHFWWKNVGCGGL